MLATFAAAGFRTWNHQPLVAPSSPVLRLALHIPGVDAAAPFEPTRAFGDLFGVSTAATVLPTGPRESTSLWHQQGFLLAGDPALVVFTQTQRLAPDGRPALARAEAPSISAAVYRLSDGRWKLAGASRDFAHARAWGEAPAPRGPLQVMQFPDGAVAFFVDEAGESLGDTQVGKSVWAFANGAWHDLGYVQTGGDNESATGSEEEPYRFSGSISMVPGSGRYPDLRVDREGTMQDDQDRVVTATDTRYVFTGRSYEEAPMRN
ncbi:hypothetical protein HHL11_23915 [Ramlibacter sp. G-1-2-2]|uniref:Uncharacterized protein n=1 Tax=Ramlibacter agri TaxID=2728837 RepID=A0A848H9X5_9BURK|nr:hypothetical protein [Ramlibacter agri]NML46812.1 hypothetical protein [Ramlibacter agri]